MHGEDKGVDEQGASNETTQTSVYLKDLERRSMSALGRKVRIHCDGKKKTIELAYNDNDDLAELLRKLCGEDFFEE